MPKIVALECFGGTAAQAADALGYTNRRSADAWPEVLPLETSDRVRGAWLRLNPGAEKPPVMRKRRRSWLVRSGRLA